MTWGVTQNDNRFFYRVGCDLPYARWNLSILHELAVLLTTLASRVLSIAC